MILLEDVTQHYRKGKQTVRALDGVTLEIPSGKLALLSGPSGSGKTTLINLVAGLARPSSGEITVAGHRLNGLTARQRAALRAREVSVVFQMFHLLPYLNTLENVLVAAMTQGHDGDHGPVEDRARQLLCDLGLEERMGHFPGELSTGECQRCALARALLNQPKIILADEPTGNLDEESARQVLETLRTHQSRGITILLVSHHHLDAIQPDLEFALKDGQLHSPAFNV